MRFVERYFFIMSKKPPAFDKVKIGLRPLLSLFVSSITVGFLFLLSNLEGGICRKRGILGIHFTDSGRWLSPLEKPADEWNP